MWGKFLHGRPPTQTRDLSAVADLLVCRCFIIFVVNKQLSSGDKCKVVKCWWVRVTSANVADTDSAQHFPKLLDKFTPQSCCGSIKRRAVSIKSTLKFSAARCRSSWIQCTSTSPECGSCWSVIPSRRLSATPINTTRRSSSLRQSSSLSLLTRINW